MKPAFLALLAAACLAMPGIARAALATMVTRDVPLAGERSLASTQPVGRFDLVGLHWRGSGTVAFRTRNLGGRWGEWRAAAPEAEDGPDSGAAESRATRGWHVGNPWWVGAANGIQYRTAGRVTALRAFFVRSRMSRLPRMPQRALAVAGAPQVVPRSGWGADESSRKQAPQVAPALRFAIVHHTAGRNGYSRPEVPAILRGIQIYHVRANGWNDIGYNFLVDRFGTIYEGRYGGVDKNVVGAHALGFNIGSVGVAVLGNYDQVTSSPAVEAGLARLLAWRLDAAHVDPLATMTLVSGGSERFPAGIPVFLRAISGHRDTGLTACPGGSLYARLGAIANAIAGVGLPKLYEPTVVADQGLVRIRARLSSPLSWTVAITDAAGLAVATGRGSSGAVDWTWDARLSAASGLRWRIAAPGVRPATGVLGAVPGVGPLAISAAIAEPAAITPNGDGQADTTTVSYRTSRVAQVAVVVLDPAGLQVAELLAPTQLRAGEHAVGFDGRDLADGRYTLMITASAQGAVVSRTVPITVTRTLLRVALNPTVFTPNGDGRRDELRVSFGLSAPALVKVRVLRDGVWVATPFAGPLAAGRQLVVWNGGKRVGRARDGAYSAAVEVTDPAGTASFAVPFTTDATPPRVALVRGATPSLRVSENASLTLRVNGAVRHLRVKGPITFRLRGIRTVRTLQVAARDDAGNVTRVRLAA